MTMLRPEAFLAQAAGGASALPLLVFRLTDLPLIAWREGRDAARRTEERCVALLCRLAQDVLREGDVIVHAPGSGDVLIAMGSGSRSGRRPWPADARAALERLGALIHGELGLSIERGWTLVERQLDPEALQHGVTAALERGRQERIRFAFFSGIGHELRTPLTAIQGYLETLLDEELPPDIRRRFLTIAHTESLRVGRLVEGMFDISLLDLYHETQSLQSCDAATAISSALTTTAAALAGSGIRLRSEIGATARIPIDQDRCMQIVVNLIDNARKHAGGIRMVRVSTHLEAAALIIRVEDDGAGVAPAFEERIFELGERGLTRSPGSGIGLALVRLLTERAGGTAWHEPSPLGGAAFCMRFPLQKRDLPQKGGKPL